MPPYRPLKQIVTSVNPRELAEIVAYAKRKKLSVYALLKKALFEYLERHP